MSATNMNTPTQQPAAPQPNTYSGAPPAYNPIQAQPSAAVKNDPYDFTGVPVQQVDPPNSHSGALTGAAVGGLGSMMLGGTGILSSIGGAIIGHQMDKKKRRSHS